jgi:hypothetical protein
LSSELTPINPGVRLNFVKADGAIPAEQKGFCMACLERIRLSISLVVLTSLIGCMNPDRARPSMLAQSPDRASTSSGGPAAAYEGGSNTAARAQNADVVQAGSNKARASSPVSSVTQASARDPGRGNPSQNVIPAGTPPAGSPVQSGVVDSASKLRELYNQAALRFATIDSYVARLRRREQVKGKDQPEELMLFKFRKQPWSVYFKWLGPTGNGREVIYVKGQHGDMIHTLLAAGDMPLAPPGKHMALAPDNVFVRSASRHPITDAGIGVMIEKFGRGLESQERGDKRLGTLAYAGLTKRPEYDTPLDTMEHLIPPGAEPQLPHGGRRWLFFDPASHLPVLMITHDDKDHEVEYYCYDRIQYPVKLDDLDFDPDKLWPMKK